MGSLLTISSHVIHGYVGNKAIVFPLQSLGWDVDIINTVNYSNHTGYGIFNGMQLLELVFGQLLENLLRLHKDGSYTPGFLLTGYFPNAELIQQFQQFLVDYKCQKQLVYLLDPIMGDQNQLYVDESCVGQYQKLLANDLVDIITPNQFELQLLTNSLSTRRPITNHATLARAINDLKSNAPNLKFIIITSFVTSDYPNDLFCVFTTRSTNKIFYYKVPLLKGYFTGVGDLFTGLILDKLEKNYYSVDFKYRDELQGLSKAVNQVLTIMTKVLVNTYNKGYKQLGKDIEQMGNLEIGAFELDIINSKDLFKSKDQSYQLEELNYENI